MMLYSSLHARSYEILLNMVSQYFFLNLGANNDGHDQMFSQTWCSLPWMPRILLCHLKMILKKSWLI